MSEAAGKPITFCFCPRCGEQMNPKYDPSSLVPATSSAPVFALPDDDLIEIYILAGMVCSWKMSLPTQMIKQAQKVVDRMIKLSQVKLLINIQHEETGRMQEWPVDKPIPHGWARVSGLYLPNEKLSRPAAE